MKQKMLRAVECDDFQELRGLIPANVHIGKSSAGWKFVFNHNNWEYWDKTLESMCEFLKNSDIENEYGVPITYDEFWSRVKATDGMIDGKEYYTNWDKYHKHFATGEPLPLPDYIPANYGEEYHFGIRFSDCTEFC